MAGTDAHTRSFYEGYTMEEIAFPIRVLKALGVGTLIGEKGTYEHDFCGSGTDRDVIVTNAAGGLNGSYAVGDIVVMGDVSLV